MATHHGCLGAGRLGRAGLLLAGALALGPLLHPAPARAGEPPAAQYTVVRRTGAGQVIATQRRDAPTLEAALRLTVRDLARSFGNAPRVRSAYQDARTPGAGGASFTAAVQGAPAKGLIICRVDRGTAHVVVAFVRADAPPAEWRRLMQPEGGASQPAERNAGEAGRGAATGGGGPAGGAAIALTTYRFPDGTGSVGLAPGWTTRTQSALGGVLLHGPDGELVAIALGLTVQLPGSPMSRGPGALVAPFTSPEDVMRRLAPQLSAISVRGGGPAWRMDGLEVKEQRRSTAPGGQAAVLVWGAEQRARGGAERHVKAMTTLDMSPPSAGSFLVNLTEVRAPDADYERDRPAIMAMIDSLHVDQERLAGKVREVVAQRDAADEAWGRQAVASRQAWFKNQQAAHQAQVSAFDAHNRAWHEQQAASDARNRDWERQQNAQSRRNDDFDEVLRGYRTVEDTRSGERTSVTLGDVDKIVDDLTTIDPGRYRQIPLRDELDPLPGR